MIYRRTTPWSAEIFSLLCPIITCQFYQLPIALARDDCPSCGVTAHQNCVDTAIQLRYFTTAQRAVCGDNSSVREETVPKIGSFAMCCFKTLIAALPAMGGSFASATGIIRTNNRSITPNRVRESQTVSQREVDWNEGNFVLGFRRHPLQFPLQTLNSAKEFTGKALRMLVNRGELEPPIRCLRDRPKTTKIERDVVLRC